MFNMYVSVPFRSSTFLSDVKVDLVNAKAVAYFQDGSVYGYRNVSKRAIMNILVNPSISLGFEQNFYGHSFRARSHGFVVGRHGHD